MDTATKVCRGLVLAGGGARGSYQIGVWRALDELGWTAGAVTGTSVGCLNGAMYALGQYETARDMWLTIHSGDVMELPDPAAGPRALGEAVRQIVAEGGLDISPLEGIVARVLDEEALRASPVRFGLVTVEKRGLRPRELTLEEIPRGQLADYLLASAACYPAMPARNIDGVEYLDGGYFNNMPTGLAARLGAEELVCVDLEGLGFTRPNRTGLPTRVIRSHWDLGPMFDFDGVRAVRNMALGYLDTLRVFGRVGGTAYALLPDPDGFLPKFAAAYQQQLSAAVSRAPTLALAETMARQRRDYPAPFSQNLLAPTRGASAPLELAAEKMNVPPEEPYTPRLLALTFLGSFDRDPADRFRVLLGREEGNHIGETAMAAAAPDDFVTALVSHTLQEMRFF